jgi:hypothetical protein
MLIWLNLLIPLFAVLVLFVFFKKRMVWWEYLLVFGIPIVLILACKYTAVFIQTGTKEWWNSYVTGAAYYEDWDEWVVQTCTRTVSCGKDCETVEVYDCSHNEYHPPEWKITDNIGQTYSVSREFYEFLVKLWANQKFTDLHRDYDSNDGDMYSTVYDGRFEHLIPLCSQHTYINKVRSSRSIFNFQEISKEDVKRYGLYDYPKTDLLNYNPILGWDNRNHSDLLRKWNGKLGAYKRVHMLVLVFHDKPSETGLMQEAYWKGGNKNEFILCIGIDKNRKIRWTKVISWTDVQALKVTVARKVKEMDTLNMPAVIDTMVNRVNSQFIKKDFRDFNYLSVEPSDMALLITALITLTIVLGLSIFCVVNDKREGRYV